MDSIGPPVGRELGLVSACVSRLFGIAMGKLRDGGSRFGRRGRSSKEDLKRKAGALANPHGGSKPIQFFGVLKTLEGGFPPGNPWKVSGRGSRAVVYLSTGSGGKKNRSTLGFVGERVSGLAKTSVNSLHALIPSGFGLQTVTRAKRPLLSSSNAANGLWRFAIGCADRKLSTTRSSFEFPAKREARLGFFLEIRVPLHLAPSLAIERNVLVNVANFSVSTYQNVSLFRGRSEFPRQWLRQPSIRLAEL